MGRGPPSANGAPQQQRSRSRPRSRVRLNRNNFNNNQQTINKRSRSVNSRLGSVGPAPTRRRGRFATNTRTHNPNTQLNKPLGGRVMKRKPRNPIAGRVQKQNTGRPVRKNPNQFRGNALNAIGGANARRGKIIKRWILES